MNIKNIEFKARVRQLEDYEGHLRKLNPRYKGLDHQIDTYFHARQGRLKLREGTIENALINYDRADTAQAKESQVILYRHENNAALKKILTKQLGVKVVVDKYRKIYFIDNVKFHFDDVKNLGTFIEVEAQDFDNSHTVQELQEQCDKYFEYFDLTEGALIKESYSDLLLHRDA